MTVRAPLATPVACCDAHQRLAWQAGERAVRLNGNYLEALAQPHARWRRRAQKVRQVALRFLVSGA